MKFKWLPRASNQQPITSNITLVPRKSSIPLRQFQSEDSLNTCRSEVFFRKGVFKNFAKSTGKHLCQNLYFNKVAGLRSLKKRLWNRCFHVNFVKVLRTPPVAASDMYVVCHSNSEPLQLF